MATDYEIFRPGIQDHTVKLYRMILRGRSVQGIMHELGMERGAVLRAWQRACNIDSRFPPRDPRTDRADFSAVVVATADTMAPWDADAKCPNTSRLQQAARTQKTRSARLTAASK